MEVDEGEEPKSKKYKIGNAKGDYDDGNDGEIES